MFTGKDGLNCAGLRAVAFDRSGRLWIGSDIGLDIYEENGTTLNCVESMPIGMVDCLAVGDHEAWVGTPSGLYHWNASRGIDRVGLGALDSATISSCVLTPKGTLWVAGPVLGIARFGQHEWCWIDAGRWRTCGRPARLAVGPEETILFGGESGLGLLEDDGRLHGHFSTDLPVTALHFSGGQVWAGIGETMMRFSPVAKEFLLIDKVLEGSRINHAVSDDIGNIWVSTENDGLARLSCLRHVLSRPKIADIGAILCVRATPEGTYLGGTNGAIIPDGDVILRGTKVWDISSDSDGIVWAASENGLVCLANPTLAIPFVHKSLVLLAPCRVLHRSCRAFYVGSVRGLVCLSPAGLEEIVTPVGGSLGYVYSLFEDRDGALWIGTFGNGLWRLVDGKIERISADHLPHNANVASICQSGSGAILVAHNNRISRIDGAGTPVPFFESEDAVSAWAIGFHDKGTLLIGTSSGLKQLDPETGAVLRTIAGAPADDAWEFTTSRSLAFAPDGSVLCGTGDGLNCVKMVELERLNATPAVHVAEVRWHGIDPVKRHDGWRVKPGKWQVDVDLWTDWSIDELACEMRYRLLGFTSEWSNPQPPSRISFNSLPSGSYALEAKLSSPLCGTGNSSILCTIKVDGALTTLASALSTWLRSDIERKIGVDWVNRRKMSRRNRELEQLIGERTSELQSVNEQLRSAAETFEHLSFTDPMTGIGNRRAFDAPFAAAFEASRTHGTAMSFILFDCDHFKLFNDSYGHAAGDESLKRVAAAAKAQLRKTGDFVARVGGEEFAVVLPGANLQAAVRVAERIRMAIKALDIPHARSPIAEHLTVSLGVATNGDGITRAADLFAVADDLLYCAKEAGRDRLASEKQVA